jgi:hypothetical protein
MGMDLPVGKCILFRVLEDKETERAGDKEIRLLTLSN